MLARTIAVCSTLTLLIGLSVYSAGNPPQTRQMARREPHMSAALGHLQQARNELDKATATKGGHRENAMRLVDQAIAEVQQGEVYDIQH
ncbi:MAG: hypothetical protein DMG97_00155 [Acidobacteria bacterium]|nr:MAG: hypothetical protein DMG98_07275 [Acidobacteriota bacterium]PYV68687.1 MAG: hypothetical protein DMG96_35810 [Acidobacteriota bacterium]PYV78090.1 MAG: hypothetical protein DMG97_00155 [Acidobacteriota bacterium]